MSLRKDKERLEARRVAWTSFEKSPSGAVKQRAMTGGYKRPGSVRK